MKILAISGSLRAGSSNGALLRALPLVSPPELEFAFREPLDALPFFNPDVEEAGPPPPVERWRFEVRDHAALVVCSPEYAHGVPGVLKNALDWLVGGTEIHDKPIAVIQTSLPSTVAHASLVEILTVIGGRVVPEASVGVTLRGLKLDEKGIASDPALSGLLRKAMTALAAAAGFPSGARGLEGASFAPPGKRGDDRARGEARKAARARALAGGFPLAPEWPRAEAPFRRPGKAKS